MLPPVASRFIGGESTEDAIEQVKELNDQNIIPILNYLGEHYEERPPVNETVDEYEQLLERIGKLNCDVAISLKPTQLGLNISRGFFFENAGHLVSLAEDYDTFVWFDMEHHHTIDDTVWAVKELMSQYSGSVGVCLQANMRDTPDRIDDLVDAEGETHIRLVKGAYEPPEEVAYLNKVDVDEKYELLIEQAFDEVDGRVAVGTHDEDMINHTLEYLEDNDPEADLQFQMLKGVRGDRQKELASEYSMAQYVPYGPQWISYTYRRIKENPKNLFFIGRAVYESFFGRV